MNTYNVLQSYVQLFFFLDIPSSYAKIWGGGVGENNGQLRFVRHHGWRTQARLDQKSDRTLAVQKKRAKKSFFSLKKKIT